MYTPNDKDEVAACTVAPAPSAGAPIPIIPASDNSLVLCYEAAGNGESYAAVYFVRPKAHYFGPPNDEALNGHPLSPGGLKPNGIFEVKKSSWIRSLSCMNEQHPNPDPQTYEKLRHYIFTFHDETFECVAENIGEVKILPRRQALQELLGGSRAILLAGLLRREKLT